ncbi:hypothetical protein PCASD_10657 [Puccinia coronata f. sp. avenae]|uniref:Phosphoinositide phospholipase C n=1 Tax=Puccinia coronata f. sp. avenae TaxID=200324 RepID=A0A2N5UI74_9BASI|nr:hypothetical protein PCASD_10657 [Puccinia coronata f. sp. avenae]
MSRSIIDLHVPPQLRAGTLMLKVSAKKTIKTTVSLEYERGQIIWETKKGGSLNIESVREIRFGEDASYYRTLFKLSPDLEERWLTIIYLSKKSTYKMLHLIACDLHTFEQWKLTLLQILEFRRELLGGLNHMRKRQDYWLKQNWTQGDCTEDNKLDFQEIVNLCSKLNISVPESDIRAHFEIADSQTRGYLDFPAFQHFVKLMKKRPDIEALFHKFTGGRKLMSADEFTAFMKDVQHSELSPSTIHAIYAKFLDVSDSENNDAPDPHQAKEMTIEGFASFLQSADNSALHEKHITVHQDMSLPLHDYFISTSHNTYLVGNQLKGESTVEGYIRALQHGCRSVELDCWDGDAGEPVIYHGRTLTRKLLLSEALKAISKHAFVASPYPLILSLEVHCQPSQQERLAELLKSCLGAALVDQRLENDVPGALPSPKDLMYRILVKAKKPVAVADGPRPTDVYSSFDSSATSTTSGSSTSSDSDLKRRISNASTVLGERFKRIASAISIPGAPVERSVTNLSDQSPTLGGGGQTGASSSLIIPGPATGALPATKIPTAPLTTSLSSLIVYTVGVKARGFNKLTTYEPEHILSLSERTVNKFLKGGTLRMLDLIGHTRSHLTRAYPAATRVFSSNFLPHRFWAVGLQLVACNWQTDDLAMELNSAFFNQNGRSGYILKPLPLRVKGKEKEAATKMHKYELDITVISIQQLPKFDMEDGNVGIDPCVEVQVISPVPSSSCSSPPQSTKRRTKVVKGNGFNPIYHEEYKIQFQTPGEMLDICFLRLVVIDSRHGGGNGAKEEDGLVGKVCVCLGALQPGYRHLPLHDDSGQQLLFACIFIKTCLSKIA